LNTEAFPPHPRVTETMAIVESALAQYDRRIEAVQQISTTRTDATKTVAVTVNHWRWLTDVWIAPGTRAVGAAVLNARLREALASANADALQTQLDLAARHKLQWADVMRSLQELTAKYEHPAAPPAQSSDQEDDGSW
jgi:hypothetical protein